ncbi:MAG: glycosyltransferase [Planctomycetes bacterium]|nr:glycosyltransferase [Planctomycetota bacterium]
MTGLDLALWILAALALLFWIAVAADRARWWPSDHALPIDASAARASPSGRDTLVAIPARDEAEMVERCLPSLLAQADDFARLVLVDDRSGDGTGARARHLAAESPAAEKISVVDGEEPPAGWSGKLHALDLALRRGFEGPGGDVLRWVLFTDADILHPPGSVRALRAVADGGAEGCGGGGGRDLVSVMARLSTSTFWEKLLIVPFVYFFQLLYPFRRVSRPGSRCAAAAGGCAMISREMLERIGGLASIRGAVIDDVALARRAADHGGRLWLGLCPGMRSERRYSSLGGIASMVARTAFTQLRRNWALLVLCLAALAVFLVSPPIVLAAAALSGTWGALGVAACAWAVQAATLYPVVRDHGLAGGWAWTLPLASLGYMGMTALSAWRHWRGTGAVWKGRSLGGSAPAAAAGPDAGEG